MGYLEIEDDGTNDCVTLTAGSGSASNLMCGNSNGATNCDMMKVTVAGEVGTYMYNI